jgi:hypothetical protein
MLPNCPFKMHADAAPLSRFSLRCLEWWNRCLKPFPSCFVLDDWAAGELAARKDGEDPAV